MNEPYSSTDQAAEESGKRDGERHVFGWLLFPLSLFPFVALLTYDWRSIPALRTPPEPTSNWFGALGDGFAYYGYQLFGLAIWVVPAICVIGGLCLVLGRRMRPGRRELWFSVLLLCAACLMQVAQRHAPGIAALLESLNLANAGGAIGYLLMTRLLSPLLSDFGSSIVVIILALISLVAGIGFRNLCGFFAAIGRWAMARQERVETGDADPFQSVPDGFGGDDDGEAEAARRIAAAQAKEDERRRREAEKAAIKAAKLAAKEAARAEKEAAKEAARAAKAPAAAPAAAQADAGDADEGEAEDKGPYILPSVDLLKPLSRSTADHSDVGEMSQRLVDTLKIFGIDAKMSYTVQGPVVTKYAIELAPGTRYSAVTNISDNLMGALHAKSLRIEAPIPGEDRVGIEVPNRKPAGISFREIFESDAWRNAKAELPLLFGKRADGKELVADLASMPHMLVAGATGQGKSVCLNSLICGLLMTRTPEQLKLIMVDPKSVEFTAYATIPHLLVPVITDNRKVVFSLHWAVAEMEKRLKMFARARVRNIYDFNHRKTFTQQDMFGNDTEVNSDMPKTVPYIVIIIDEVADLMSQCSKEVTPDISRLTAKARAAGIHLILATQRPDAKIITGTIKANIPGRVAFKTAQAIDSRTILDDAGAENLIGRGDMLFKGKDGLLIRAQGAWISDDEIANVTDFIEKHSNTQFDERFSKKLSTLKDEEIDIYADEEDDKDKKKDEAQASREQLKAAANADDFKKAVECVANTGRASTSHFQRQMGWGYNHAAKILDMLTDRGIVSPPQGMGPRQIIMDHDQLKAILEGGDGSGAEGADDANGEGETIEEEDQQ